MNKMELVEELDEVQLDPNNKSRVVRIGVTPNFQEQFKRPVV